MERAWCLPFNCVTWKRWETEARARSFWLWDILRAVEEHTTLPLFGVIRCDCFPLYQVVTEEDRWFRAILNGIVPEKSVLLDCGILVVSLVKCVCRKQELRGSDCRGPWLYCAIMKYENSWGFLKEFHNCTLWKI